MRYLYIFLAVAILGAVGYWYAERNDWWGFFEAPLPSAPPTAEERERMAEVERTSQTQAENPKPGAGVLPPGSRPPVQPATSTEATTTEESDAIASTTDTEATSR